MFFVGLDLGQKRDFSAVAVVERPEFRHLQVRYLERMPLGTAYVQVVSRVREIMLHPVLAGGRLVVDATGVGAPVVEMLRAVRPACRVTAVTITSGEQAHGRGEEWHVPKKDLMAGLQILLEDGQLKIHRKLREASALVRELTDIRLSPKSGGRVGMGAEGYGEHDDLAVAVALACWRGRQRMEIGYGTRRLI
jgi:phage FluMu gp28-like protein